MSLDLGNVNITGTAEERTWRTTIETPVDGSGDPANGYSFVNHREIVVRDGVGNVVKVVRNQEEAHALGYTDFRSQRTFLAGAAVAITPDVLTDIVTTIEQLVADAKVAENA